MAIIHTVILNLFKNQAGKNKNEIISVGQS